MPYPSVGVSVTNGNLLRSIAVSDGIGGFVATAEATANIGEVRQVYSLKDAENKGYTSETEPFLHEIIEQFYNEIGGNQRIWILGVPETMTMTDVVKSTNLNGLPKMLMKAAGDVNRIGILRKPSAEYNAGNKFLDTDVQDAVLTSLALCQAQQNKNQPIRIFIEGRVANENVDNDFKPNTANNGFASVVLGSTKPDGSASVALAVARACKYPVHVKIGSGQNGALSATQIYIGSTALEERLDAEILHDAGFMTFQRRPAIAGYYFGVDNMCSNDDFRLLVHGGVIDKAQLIIVGAYAPYVEDYIRMESDGTINAGDAKHLEDILKASLRKGLKDQMSDIDVIIDTNQDLVNTSELEVEAAVLPLGYTTWIRVKLGLTTKIAS